MGALYLSPLDRALENLPGVKHLRFMDDWIILAGSRWKLRKAIRIMNQVLADLELEQHPDKNYIGKVSRGFDFLGVDFRPGEQDQPSVVSQTRLREKLEKHFTHAARLYEQGRLKSLETVERYLSHWLRWSKGIGIASSTALDMIKRSLNVRCQTENDVKTPYFIQVMAAWVNHQKKGETKKKMDVTSSCRAAPRGRLLAHLTCRRDCHLH